MVCRRVGTEPPRRLRELPLATDPVAATRLVPRDRDVDESLEEVPFVSRSRAPLVLELLVCGEVGTGPDQLDPLCESHPASIGGGRVGC